MRKGTIADLVIGTTGISLALLSRGLFPDEVAQIVGSHETRAVLEHFVAAFSGVHLIKLALEFVANPKLPFPIPDSIDSHEKYIPYYATAGYIGTCVIFEYIQYALRGKYNLPQYYQFDQLGADIAGSMLALIRLEYSNLRNMIKKHIL